MTYKLMDRETELGVLRLGKEGPESATMSGTWVCKECNLGQTMSLFGFVESDDGCFAILTDYLKDHYNQEHKK